VEAYSASMVGDGKGSDGEMQLGVVHWYLESNAGLYVSTNVTKSNSVSARCANTPLMTAIGLALPRSHPAAGQLVWQRSYGEASQEG